jgi:hypothetical protein
MRDIMVNNRDHHFNVYLNAEEHALLLRTAKAEALPLASWARSILLKAANKE